MIDFLGIGAQKTGTTWLHHQLIRHRALRLPEQKELHYWDAYKHRGLDWYLAQFPSGGLKGEITPAYGILPVEIIREIHSVFPELRLIFIIRNPVERAWSSAKMAVKNSEMLVKEASDQWFIDHFRSAGSLARGDYENCLRNWFSVYPRENLLLLRYEELAEDPLGLLEKCCRHLGVENCYSQLGISEKVFSSGPEPLRPSLKAQLQEMYWEKIQSLARYLGQDLSAWLE